MHTEVVTVTTAKKNLEDILAELSPTIEYDDGTASGTLALDHSTIKTETAGYKSSSYKVTFVGAISYTDYSCLNEMGDNRITLITCIANQPSLRLCVQAVEIR